jgi:hypothetical protein
MRLVTRKIWRAFPELDRFDDKRCERFCRAAYRGRGIPQRLYWWTVQALACAPLLVAAWWGVEALGAMAERDVNDLDNAYMAITGQGVIVLAVAFVGMLVWLAVGHWFIRHRLAFILTARSQCAECGYRLVGLPVDATNHVACPECGLTGEVDPSLIELGGTESNEGPSAVRRFAPLKRPMKRDWTVLTGATVWRWSKRAAYALTVIVLGTLLAFGAHEWRLRRQAVRAATLKPGVGALIGMVEKENGKDALSTEETRERVTVLLKHQAQVWSNVGTWFTAPTGGVMVEAGMVVPRTAGMERTQVDALAAGSTAARAALDGYESGGLFTDFRAILNGRGLATISDGPKATLIADSLGTFYAPVWNSMSPWLAARARLAVSQGDAVRFADSIDLMLCAARQMESHPFLDQRVTAMRMEMMALQELREGLRQHPDWTDRVEKVWSTYAKTRKTHRWALRTQRLVYKDQLCAVFADPGLVRFGRYGKGAGLLISPVVFVGQPNPHPRLGSLDELVGAFDKVFDALEAAGDQQHWQRPQPLLPQTGLAYADQIGSWLERYLDMLDGYDIDHESMPVLFAIERYRAEKGVYPASLAELVPSRLANVPLDPWSGKPFGYRRIDPAADPQGRGFYLYCVGGDGVDNGGLDAGPSANAFYPAMGGPPADFIINDGRR